METSKNLIEKAEAFGIRMFSDTERVNRASSAANTCVFSVGKKIYVLDPAFGAKRRKELAPLLMNNDYINVLCTHYHNDHCANNGWIVGKKGRTYYHHRIKNRIHYLRTNGTGQVVTMGREMDLYDMLRRFKMFPSWLSKAVPMASKYSRFVSDLFLFGTSYLYSIKSIGLIRPGLFQKHYLTPDMAEELSFDHTTVKGWKIDAGLYAMETGGHSDDHLAFYLKKHKALFSGDALNFLNGNDIQYGDIDKVDETFDFLYDFVIKEKVEILFQGHYYPIFGTTGIAEHIDAVRKKHREIRNITLSVIGALSVPFRFRHALKALSEHPSDLVQSLARITFPRSTLVFLDVYLLKVLQSAGYERDFDRRWNSPEHYLHEEEFLAKSA